jgi:hypothetical protein
VLPPKNLKLLENFQPRSHCSSPSILSRFIRQKR